MTNTGLNVLQLKFFTFNNYGGCESVLSVIIIQSPLIYNQASQSYIQSTA